MKQKVLKPDCKFITQTADSFGKYVSTYCHKKNVHIHGFKDSDPTICEKCQDYSKKGRI